MAKLAFVCVTFLLRKMKSGGKNMKVAKAAIVFKGGISIELTSDLNVLPIN